METVCEIAWGTEAGAAVTREADVILRTLARAAPSVYTFEHEIDLRLRAMRLIDVVAVMRRVRERAPGVQCMTRSVALACSVSGGVPEFCTIFVQRTPPAARRSDDETAVLDARLFAVPLCAIYEPPAGTPSPAVPAFLLVACMIISYGVSLMLCEFVFIVQNGPDTEMQISPPTPLLYACCVLASFGGLFALMRAIAWEDARNRFHDINDYSNPALVAWARTTLRDAA